MRAIAQHHQPARMLYDLALVERPRHVDEIVAIDDGLDAAAFAAIAEKNDRVSPPRSHDAIVPISRGQRKALYVAASLHQAFDAFKRQHHAERNLDASMTLKRASTDSQSIRVS